MSWNISLVNGEDLKVPKFNEGGTQVMGGSTRPEMSVTYNYGGHFAFRSLHGIQARRSIPMLKQAMERLGDTPDEDYWAHTPGNAGHACAVLLGWARLHLEAKWNVT